MRRRWFVAWLALAAACQSPVPLGTPCTRNAECTAPLVCGGGRCRAECVVSRDCPIGSECLPLPGGVGACALVQDRCALDTDCPAPLVCGADGRCRAACLTDEDCTADGRCVLAGRLVCAAATPPAPPTCAGGENADFAAGLDGWCIETSAGIDASVVTAVAEGDDRHGAQIDLTSAPVGAWVRLYQEVPLPGAENWFFERARATLDGATTLAALELLDANGLVLGRVARASAGDGTTDCTETGRATAACGPEPFQPLAVVTPIFASGAMYANVDLRRVASVRRIFELARTGQGRAVLVADGITPYEPACPYGWWRDASAVHVASFDLDHLGAPPSGFTYDDATIQAFPLAECGAALSLDGSQAIDWSGPLPPTYTVSFAWHGTMHSSSMDGVSFVHELGNDLGVSVIRDQITVRGCGVSIVDPMRIAPADARFQEMQLMVDRAAGRVCLARSGHVVDCAAASCTAAATGLRFGESMRSLADHMAIDEIRIDEGVAPIFQNRAASGTCILDLTCHEGTRLELRDLGSSACVRGMTCTSIYVCPEAARGASCSSTIPTRTCGIDPSCPLGVRDCDGSPCAGLRPDECMQPLAASCP